MIFHIFSKNFIIFRKNTKKQLFPKTAEMHEFRWRGAVFSWKGGTFSIYLGGGGYPLFSEYTKDRGSFLDPLFLGVFFLKKTEKFFFEKKNFLKNKKKFFIK